MNSWDIYRFKLCYNFLRDLLNCSWIQISSVKFKERKITKINKFFRCVTHLCIHYSYSQNILCLINLIHRKSIKYFRHSLAPYQVVISFLLHQLILIPSECTAKIHFFDRLKKNTPRWLVNWVKIKILFINFILLLYVLFKNRYDNIICVCFQKNMFDEN